MGHWTVSLYPSTHHHDATLFYLNINSHLVFKLCRKHFQLSSMICCCVVHICCKSAPVPGPNVRCQKYWQESKEGTSLKIPALIKSNLRFDQLGRQFCVRRSVWLVNNGDVNVLLPLVMFCDESLGEETGQVVALYAAKSN